MLGRRDEQKLRTRGLVLAAARKLFADPGYDATTIRMIAMEAGVATGSVFTTFASKQDVLFAITGEVFEEISDRLTQRLRQTHGSTRERLKLFYAEAFAAMHERMALIMVHFGLSWRWDRDFEAAPHNPIGKIFAIALDVLKDGVRAGDIHCDTDLGVLADVLVDIYVRNLRSAWRRRLEPAMAAQLSERQIDLVFDGACNPKRA